MYRIIATDLDGTLLSKDHKITEYTKNVIKFLSNHGIYFVLASGRHYIDVMRIRDILEIDAFMITSNGAEVYNLDGTLIFKNNLYPDIAKKLCKIKYLDCNIITQLFKNDQWYVNNTNTDNKFCPSLSSLKYEYFDVDHFDYTNISKIFFTGHDLHKLNKIEKVILSKWHTKVNISFSSSGCLEVVSKQSSKGYGLQLIAKLLNISLKDFISFGDGMNDEDMLKMCGKSCIMKNADLRLKMMLPNLEVIGSNDDGVAKFLNKTLIKNRNIIHN